MGCVSSKILTKSGSFQESVSHSFQRSNNVIEEIILSSSKSNGDQFLALLCKSSSFAQKSEQSAVVSAVAAEVPAKIEMINVSELLAGLEEEKEEQGDGKEGDRSPSPAPQCAAPLERGAAGRARSFRTVEEFDALVTQSGGGGSSEQVTAPAPPALDKEEEEETDGAAAATTSSHGEAAESSSSGQEEQQPESAGAKRRVRARQLGELKVPATFDFSKSGSLRDWLLRGGQIFSPGSYVTPKFGTAPALPAPEHIHIKSETKTCEKQQHAAVFDPELVAQFERAMEQLSEDEERVLTEILDALEQEAGEKDGTATLQPLGRVSHQPVAVAARQE